MEKSILLDDNFVKDHLPKRSSDSNKGSFGKTLLVCGSKNFPGAALLASKAAASIGSGLTSLATTKEVFSDITSGIPEVIHVDFNLQSIVKESKKASVIVIGPGLGSENEVKELVEKLLIEIEIPIILDADGINAFENKKDYLKKAKKHLIITPHAKEFARLLNTTVENILENKMRLCIETSKELNCTVILKGSGTIISTKDGEVFISPFANSALAKGGTGDVLSGFIGGLIAQGLEPAIASCLAVYIHGKLGEVIALEKTEYSLLPQDLISYLPKVIKMYLQTV